MQEYKPYPFILDYLPREYLWGGKNLASKWNKKGTVIAESWELSINDTHTSVIKNGVCAKLSLAAVLADNPQFVGRRGIRNGFFPLLVKLIDAEKTLSIQVHPDDETALATENQLGKREMWYICDAEDGAEIYLGLNRDVTKEELAAAIADSTVESLLNSVKVKSGDCFLVKEGTLHAIRGGVTLLEVQENSNVTYRVYDYDRVGADGKKRELHVEKALAVADLSKLEISEQLPHVDNNKFFNKKRVLVKDDFFTVSEYNIANETIFIHEDSFATMTVVDGSGEINGYKIKKGDTVFIPAGLRADISGRMLYIVTTV